MDFTDLVNEHIDALNKTMTSELEILSQITGLIVSTFKIGGKLLIFGNGGSAADAQHVAAEFTNRFEIERPPLAAIALTTDTSALTAIGNDYSFDQIFSKQIEAIANDRDLIIGISTSGNSPNVIRAFDVAKKNGLTTVLFTGNKSLNNETDIDYILRAQSSRTATIQEVHIFIWHLICTAVDYKYRIK